MEPEELKSKNPSPASAGNTPAGLSRTQEENLTNVEAAGPSGTQPKQESKGTATVTKITESVKKLQVIPKESGCKRRALRKEKLEEQRKETGEEEASTSQKRGRQETGTPPSASEKKRPRSEATATFSETTAGIKLAVVPENFPEERLDPKQGDLIIQALLDEMIAIEDNAPSFVKVAHETGAVVVVAHDEASAEWANAIIPSLRPWENARLVIGPAGKILATHKVHVWVPNYPRQFTAPVILKLLTTQNQGLMAKDWRVLHRSVEETRTAWVFMIGDDSLAVLRRLGFRVSLGTQRVHIQLLGRDAGPPDQPAPQ